MERRDLYNENKELTGETIFKGDPVPKGRYYITVVVFIQNDDGKFLIQKRVKKKDGKWATTGGHPVSGESSKQGILTEIKEELGIDIQNDNIELFKTIKTEDDFVDLYYLKENIDIENVVVQQDEVESAKWASIDEIKDMIQNNIFSESHAEFFYMCLNYINDKRSYIMEKIRGFEIAKGWEDKDINLPIRKTKYAAGYDFEAAEDTLIPAFKPGVKPTLIPTGIKSYMLDDEVLYLYNRSSNPKKKGLILANSVGVVDKDYYGNEDNDGHIMFAFYNIGEEDIVIKKGEAIGQGVFSKYYMSDDDNASGDRIGGFGSTSK